MGDPGGRQIILAGAAELGYLGASDAPEFVVWGSGSPRREFLHVDDAADACLFVMQRYNGNTPLNVGTGEDVTIRELAELLKDVVGYRGTLRFDAGKPDGMPRKLLDVSRLTSYGWQAKVSLRHGVEETYAWYRSTAGKKI